MTRFAKLVPFVEKKLRDYNSKDATLEVEKFVSDLSTWYIRRSRDRIWVNSDDKADKQGFYQAMQYMLINLSIILSPFMPFITEEIFINLLAEKSVHLADWPKVDKSFIDVSLEEQMNLARQIVEAGHAKRKSEGIKVRIPLAKLEIAVDVDAAKIPNEIWDIVLKELNVKNIVVNKKIKPGAVLHLVKYPKEEVKITEEQLKKEGELRELLRHIQGERRALGLKPMDKINLTIPEQFLSDKEYLMKKVMAKKIAVGDEIIVKIN